MSLREPMVRWLCFSNFVSNSAYGVCAPFLPLEFERKGLPGSLIGIIFALYSVGSILMSPVVGKHGERFAAKNLLGGSLALMGITFICFGFIDDMENRVNIIVLGSVLRLLEGIQCATQVITCLSVATNDFPDQKEHVFGLVIAASAFGLIAGPLVGSILYSFLEFKRTFFVYGGAQAVLALLIRLRLPARKADQQA